MNDRTQAADLSSRAGPAALSLAPATGREGAIAEEQLAYAGILDSGMKLGLLLLVATFVAYLSGVPSPHVPVADLPRYWTLPVKDYLAATGAPAGWGWVALLHRGDYLNFVGIAFLSGVTIVCYLAILPIFLRRRDRAFAALAAAEVVVLALAASGLLAAGGH